MKLKIALLLLTLSACAAPGPFMIVKRGSGIANAPVNEGHGGVIRFRNNQRSTAYQQMHDYCKGTYSVLKEETVTVGSIASGDETEFRGAYMPTTNFSDSKVTTIRRQQIAFECQEVKL